MKSLYDNEKTALGGAQTLEEKAKKLSAVVSSIGRTGTVTVAYSGGVDSTLVLKVAKDVLGDSVRAVTASSVFIPRKEVSEAVALAKQLGVDHRVIPLEPLDDPRIASNPPDRCYYCKNALYEHLHGLAKEAAAEDTCFVDGTNEDDQMDYRPGQRATTEHGVRSPLWEAGFGKDDVRALSQSLDLPTWDKPSMACLASRFPYGQELTADKLGKVEEAENAVAELGIRQVRVRFHDEHTARIEVEPENIHLLLAPAERQEIVRKLQALGFLYVTIDLKGYQTGSLNELLK